MKLLYATSIRFPSSQANRLQVLARARALAVKFGRNFYLGGNEIDSSPDKIQIVNFGVKKSWKLGWRYMRLVKQEQITYIYCREARLFFFIVLYNFLFFHLPLHFSYEVHALLGRSIFDYLADGFLSRFVHCYFFTTGHLQKIYSRKYHLK